MPIAVLNYKNTCRFSGDEFREGRVV